MVDDRGSSPVMKYFDRILAFGAMHIPSVSETRSVIRMGDTTI